MFRCVFGKFVSIMLIAAIWGLHSAAQAQTADDYPTSSFTGSLVEPSLDRVAIRRTDTLPPYSTVRLASGRLKVHLATTLSIHNPPRRDR